MLFLGLASPGCEVEGGYTYASGGGSNTAAGGNGGAAGAAGGGSAKGASGAAGTGGRTGASGAAGVEDAGAGGEEFSGGNSGSAATGGAPTGPASGGSAGRGAGGDPADVCPLSERSCTEAGLLGPCAEGVQSCLSDGAWGECSILPEATDTCAQNDDSDCDGVPNQNANCDCIEAAQRSCSAGGALGNCAKGVQTCSTTGSWQACSVKAAVADSCTKMGDDADCNGTPNSGCPCVEGQTQPCGPSVAQGICKFGVSTCVNELWGTCQNAVLAKARNCTSALDNDCDGKPDNTLDAVCQCAGSAVEACGEHIGQDGKGRCQAGERACVVATDKASSSWGACTGSIGPAAVDLCTVVGDDSDCNGVVNQACACIAGKTSTCAEVYGSPGDCAATPLTCTNAGKWPAASASCAAAGSELCNTDGRDENCDGRVNEGCACTTGEDCGPCKLCNSAGACVVNKATGTDCGVCLRCNAQGSCAPGYVGAADPTGCNGAQTCSANTKTAAQACDANGLCKAATSTCSTGCSGNDCTPARCGDKVVNQASETCDDGNIVNTDACSTNCKACGGVVGPTLEGTADDNSRHFGMQITATANSTIYSFGVHTLGVATDVVLVEKVATGTRPILQTISVAAGPPSPVDVTVYVTWPLTAGKTYLLYQTRKGNGRFESQTSGAFPNNNAPGVRVDGAWDEGTDNFDPPIPEHLVLTVWYDITDIRSCLN